MNKQLFSTAIITAVFVLIAQFVSGLVGQSVLNLGGAGTGYTHYQTENFLQGLYAGTSGQFHVSNSGAITNSGTLAQTGIATFSGASTFASTLQVDSVRYGGLPLNVATTTKILSAAEACDYSAINFAAQAVSSTLRFPSSTAMISDCLSLIGGSKLLKVFAASSSAADIALAVGDASTTIYFPNEVNASGTYLQLNTLMTLDISSPSSTTGAVNIIVNKYK